MSSPRTPIPPVPFAGDPRPSQLVARITRSGQGYGWQIHEVAALTGSSISTVNTHVRRGLAKLRTELGVEP